MVHFFAIFFPPLDFGPNSLLIVVVSIRSVRLRRDFISQANFVGCGFLSCGTFYRLSFATFDVPHWTEKSSHIVQLTESNSAFRRGRFYRVHMNTSFLWCSWNAPSSPAAACFTFWEMPKVPESTFMEDSKRIYCHFSCIEFYIVLCLPYFNCSLVCRIVSVRSRFADVRFSCLWMPSFSFARLPMPSLMSSIWRCHNFRIREFSCEPPMHNFLTQVQLLLF